MADDGFDNELLKALKFLRDEDEKNADDDNESATFLSQEVIDAIESQGVATTAQNAALLEAIREQNVVLSNLLAVLHEQEEVEAAAGEVRRSTKTKVIYVTKNDEQSKEVVDAIAEAEAAILAKEEKKDVTAAVVAAASVAAVAAPDAEEEEEATEEHTTTSTPPEETVTASKRGPSVVTPPATISVKTKVRIVITGPWRFVESDVASKRRNRIKKNGTSDDILKKEDSLFGNVIDSYDDDEGFDDELQGDSFGKCYRKLFVYCTVLYCNVVL
jgi:hypothetical protein